MVKKCRVVKWSGNRRDEEVSHFYQGSTQKRFILIQWVISVRRFVGSQWFAPILRPHSTNNNQIETFKHVTSRNLRKTQFSCQPCKHLTSLFSSSFTFCQHQEQSASWSAILEAYTAFTTTNFSYQGFKAIARCFFNARVGKCWLSFSYIDEKPLFLRWPTVVGIWVSHPCSTDLCHSCVPGSVCYERFLVADLEVEVDDLVREGGELVAEAEAVLALLVRRPREAVVLFLRVFVQGLTVRPRQLHVHVIIASRDHLKTKNCWMTSVSVQLLPLRSCIELFFSAVFFFFPCYVIGCGL